MTVRNQFSAFVKQVNKSKVVCQQLIDRYTELLNAKMEEYFNGGK